LTSWEVGSYKADGILSIKADVGYRSRPLSDGPGVPGEHR
jgi:hypothetical protein